VANGRRSSRVVVVAAVLSLVAGAGVVAVIGLLIDDGSGAEASSRGAAELTAATSSVAGEVGQLLRSLESGEGGPASNPERALRRLERQGAAARALSRRAGEELEPDEPSRAALVKANEGLSRTTEQLLEPRGAEARQQARRTLPSPVRLRAAIEEVDRISRGVDALARELEAEAEPALEQELEVARGNLPRPDVDVGRDANVVLAGVSEQALAGSTVAGLGDVNGDGRDDLAVAAQGERTIYVIPGGQLPAQAELGQSGFAITSIPGGDDRPEIDDLPYVDPETLDVAPAGDVNGDGLADMIVGAGRASGAGDEEAGAAYVVYGSRSISDVDVGALGSRGYTLTGPGPFWQAGTSVSGVGDVNGDGRDDIAVGGRQHAGREDVHAAVGPSLTWVLYGGSERADLQLPARGAPPNGFTIHGIGDSLSRAGDVNGDGLEEIVGGDSDHRMGIPGAAGVVFGSRSPSPTLDARSPGKRGIALRMRRGRMIGEFVSSAGDYNGDGLADVAVGSYSADLSEDDPYSDPRVEVVYGRRSPGVVRLGSLGSAGVRLEGVGPVVAGAGDVNGDSIADLAVEARTHLSPTRSFGGARVLFGTREVEATVVNARTAAGFALAGAGIAESPSDLAALGRAGSILAGIGDIDGDGRDDIGLGAPFHGDRGEGSSFPGSAFLVFAQPREGPVSPLSGTVSAAGLGAIDVGSPVAAAEDALGTELGPPLHDCGYLSTSDARIGFLTDTRSIARVDVGGPGYATEEGIEVGDPEEAVRTAYGGGVRRTPHEYQRGSYLTVATPKPGVPGAKIVFSTDGDSVTFFSAGRSPEVELIEGCH